MKEIKEILASIDRLADGEKAILATVVDVRGSGYRLPGARMLMLANGDTYGTVSGGCLEADVLERAKKVLSTGRAELFTYDTTGDENSVFSLNMGCRGVVDIFLEPVDSQCMLIRSFQALLEMRFPQKIATLIRADSEIDVHMGGRVFYSDLEQFDFEGLPGFLESLSDLTREIESLPDSNQTLETQTMSLPEGNFTFAFETLEPPIVIRLFGAGADAVPFVRIAAELGWQVTVHDHRPAFLTEERFPTARKLVLQKIDEPPAPVIADDRTAGVIMTHNYQRDRFVLPALLDSNVFYIGALGPKRRTEQLLEEVAATGQTFTEDQLDRLFAPAGLDIGADTPEGIALSIIGEIQSVLRSRNGGHLRNRQGSIYDRK